MTANLLFISGAGLPDWIWDEAGAGLDGLVAKRPWGTNPTLAEYAQAALTGTGTGALTLVAHSAGGIVAAAIAALVPERVRGILGIAAVIPDPGRSFLGMLPLSQRMFLSAVMLVAGTRPPAAAIGSGVAAGVPDEVRRRIIADFDPESQAYYRNRAPEFELPEHRGYLTTAEDREIPPARQRRFAARLTPDYEARLATGHLPMLERPAELRAGIAEFQANVRR